MRTAENIMGLPNLQEFIRAHCRFRLRSGREVFGVVWEAESSGTSQLYFASIGEYERHIREPNGSILGVQMLPEEILLAERLAC